MGKYNRLAMKKLIITLFGSCDKLNINISLWQCKCAHGKDKQLLNQKRFNVAYNIENLLYEFFSAEHYKMSHLLSIGQMIDTRTWKISILLSFAHRFI
jgi:hypothetical protein